MKTVNVIAVSSCKKTYQCGWASNFKKARHKEQKEADYFNKNLSRKSGGAL